MKTIPPALKWSLLSVAGLVVVLVLFLALFDWNLLRGPLASTASSHMGRPVNIFLQFFHCILCSLYFQLQLPGTFTMPSNSLLACDALVLQIGALTLQYIQVLFQGLQGLFLVAAEALVCGGYLETNKTYLI